MQRPKGVFPTLRNNVGGELILDVGNAVPQVELALFEPLHLELVEARAMLQCGNCGVEVAMLLLQSRQLLLQLPLFFLGHELPEIARPPPAGAKSIAFYPYSFKRVGTGTVKQSGDCCPALLKTRFESGRKWCNIIPVSRN